MKKVLFTFSILVFIVFTAFCADVYFTPFDKSFNVDLETSYDGAGEKGDYTGGEYGDADMVGILGVTSRNGGSIGNKEYTLTFTLLDYDGLPLSSDDTKTWMYKSKSDPSITIPFGLDLVVRYTQTGDATNRTSGVIRLGPYRDDNRASITTIDYSDGETKLSGDLDVLPLQKRNTTRVLIKTGPNWNAFWIDVVLVVPTGQRESLADSGKINVGYANDYQAAFQLNVSGGGSGEASAVGDYTVYMTGYYGSEPSGEGAVLFTVNPNVNATNIPLDALPLGGEVEIGRYYYSTVGLRNADYDEPNYDKAKSPFRIFVSSSDNPLTSNGRFYLRHVNAMKGNESDALRIPFSIRMTSDDQNEKTYYGDNTIDNADFLKCSYIFETTREGENLKSISWGDEGTIFFVLSPDVVKENLVSGYYQADVYIHLSSVY